ncbi:MAG: copper homeostasis protein CutC [Rickettsiales bacterium]|jgi:copper homeostasis protein|nr:copper homeostasis protein CutC [Rickettsiales bacterium]
MIYEAVIENAENLEHALARGAGRIELCDNMAAGGTTASIGVAKHVLSRCRSLGIPVMAMIRPRGGGYAYFADEIQIMLDDMAAMREIGMDGAVFGAITADWRLDMPAIEVLSKAAGPMQKVFHRAFDHIAESERLGAIDALAGLGFARILTHGGDDGSGIMQNAPKIREYIKYAAGRITMLPIGGINAENRDAVASATGAGELHGTKIV